MAIPILGSVIEAASKAFVSRREGKNVEKTLEAKIVEKQMDTEAQVTFNDQEWEKLGQWASESTWKDEYITVSVLAIFNIIVIGAIAQAFGYGQVLEGIKLAVTELNNTMSMSDGSMSPIGKIMSVTIYAGLGIYAWRKI
jgi:hypothetical protein